MDKSFKNRGRVLPKTPVLHWGRVPGRSFVDIREQSETLTNYIYHMDVIVTALHTWTLLHWLYESSTPDIYNLVGLSEHELTGDYFYGSWRCVYGLVEAR